MSKKYATRALLTISRPDKSMENLHRTTQIRIRLDRNLTTPNLFGGFSWESDENGSDTMLIQDLDSFRRGFDYLRGLDWDEGGNSFLFSASIRVQKTLVSASAKASLADLARLCISRVSTMGVVLAQDVCAQSSGYVTAPNENSSAMSVLLRHERERWRSRWVIVD